MKNIFKKNQLMITALAIMIAIAGYLQYAENTSQQADSNAGIKSVDSGRVITENYTADEIKERATADALDGILDLSEEDLLTLSGNTGLGEQNMDMENTDIGSLDSDINVVMENYLEDGMETVASLGITENTTENGPKAGEIPGEAVYTSANALEILADAKLLKEQTRARNKETLLSIIGNEFLSADQKQEAVNSMVAMTEIAEKEAAAEILLEAKGFSDVVVSVSGDGADVVVNAAELTDAQRAQIEDIVKRKTGAAPENIIISTMMR